MSKHLGDAPVVAWLIFLGAALLEVGGDALIRLGLRANDLRLIVAGFVPLGCYGLVVNLVKWDFAELLGAYVAVFALVSILGGHFLFKEKLPVSTWVGLGFIVTGALIIQFLD